MHQTVLNRFDLLSSWMTAIQKELSVDANRAITGQKALEPGNVEMLDWRG
jgi:hypothetical protein